MRKLIILSPNDRYNYGDLLFSYIIQNRLKSVYSAFEIISTTDKDLTNVGGEKVKGLSTLKFLPKGDTYDLILGGGESLLCDWLFCYKCLNKDYKDGFLLSRLQYYIGRYLGAKRLLEFKNFVGRILMGGKTEYPYSISKNELPFVNKIFYNTIGLVGNSKHLFSHRKIKKLKKIDYISVRDTYLYDTLSSFGIEAFMRPDSAILMSEVFSKSFLEKRIHTFTTDYVNKHQYVFFQINLHEGEKHFSEIMTFLRLILEKTSFDLCLCPIGYVPEHDDPAILKKIYNSLSSIRVSLLEDNNIWDIMYLISNSKCYVGSSLHGVVTAMSFAVPHLALYCLKATAFIELWGIEYLKLYQNKDTLFEKFKKVINVDKDLLISNRLKLINIVNQNFDEIISKANED